MPGWIKMDEGYFHDPKIRRLGLPGSAIFAALLLEAKMKGRGGRLSDDYWDGWHIADLVRCDPDDAEKAMGKIVELGLIQIDDDEIVIVHWGRYQKDPTGADRSQRWRDKQKSRSDTPRNGHVTPQRQTGEERTGEDGTGVEKRKKRKTIVYPAEFECFWKAYPKKVGKGQAARAWEAAKRFGDWPGGDAIVGAVDHAASSADWKKDGGQFIPHPATWLNGARWSDELKEDGAVYKELLDEFAAEKEILNG
ncbi:MAG: hypothetical protein GY851_07330 [bacterium]|nr:hypothetical protein [bacterium]